MVHQHGLPRGLLRAHVPHRPHHVAGPGQRRVRLASGQPEVRDPQLARVVQQQVGRLHVAVHDAMLVGAMQGPGRLDAQPRDRPEVLGRVAAIRAAAAMVRL